MKVAIEKFVNKHGGLIGVIGALVAILSASGFNINIPQFYNSLDIESKILFIGLFNFVITMLVLIYFLNKKRK
jgi:hypothetical protein